jgi:hypothetical protein
MSRAVFRVASWLMGWHFWYFIEPRCDLPGNLWWILWWLPRGSWIMWWSVISPVFPVLFFHLDSHHPGLPRRHTAAQGWPRGLLHEHTEHRAVGPEVNPGPSKGVAVSFWGPWGQAHIGCSTVIVNKSWVLDVTSWNLSLPS